MGRWMLAERLSEWSWLSPLATRRAIRLVEVGHDAAEGHRTVARSALLCGSANPTSWREPS
jgi:hypothetical protein